MAGCHSSEAAKLLEQLCLTDWLPVSVIPDVDVVMVRSDLKDRCSSVWIVPLHLVWLCH